MLRLIGPYVVGLVLGVPLVFCYSRLRSRSVAYRLGVGLLVGVGIGFTFNAAAELFQLASDGSTASTEHGSSREQKASAVASKAVDALDGNADKPTSWAQEQRDEDGKLKARRTVTRDSAGELVPHGPATTYYENGQVKWSGHYEMGRQVGSWEEYYPDGTKEGEGSLFADGRAEETHWHNNGEVKSQGTWRHGLKHGVWKTWYATGQQAGLYPFQDGKLDGDVREWHPNGQLKLQAHFEAGEPLAPVKRWDEIGMLTSGDAP